MVILRDAHTPIIERSFWEYLQCKFNLRKSRKRAGKQSLFSGFLRCGDCGSNLHYHFNQTNPHIEYYNCSNYVGNRGACPDTHYVRLDNLKEVVLSELNHLITVSKQAGFWSKITSQQMVQVQEKIDKLLQDDHVISRRVKEIAEILRNVYEDKVKGVIDDETFVMLVNSFKKERGELRNKEQQIQEQLEEAQRFQGGFELFKKLLKGQGEILVLTRDIVGQFIDWIAVYPADRSVKPYRQKIEIYYQFIGKVELE